MRLFNIFLLLLIIPNAAAANRVSSLNMNLSKPQAVNIGPGLVTVIEFPEEVLEARVGAPSVFKVVVSPGNARELVINVGESAPYKTNLIVRTVKRTFLFDLNPSLDRHQDFIQIKSGYLGLAGSQSRVLDSVKLELDAKARRRVKSKIVQREEIR